MSKTNASVTKLPDPERFGLTSFLDLLPKREQMPAQASQDFEEFRLQLLRALLPGTAYECVTADNLIALEWELQQHRRMRDRCYVNNVREKVVEAYIAFRRDAHEAELDKEYDDWIDAGHAENDFVNRLFDKKAARRAGEALALRAVDPNPETALKAENEIAGLGMDLLSVLANVFATWNSHAGYHDRKIAELEKRKRDVKRDLDALRSLRPAEIIEMIG